MVITFVSVEVFSKYLIMLLDGMAWQKLKIILKNLNTVFFLLHVNEILFYLISTL